VRGAGVRDPSTGRAVPRRPPAARGRRAACFPIAVLEQAMLLGDERLDVIVNLRVFHGDEPPESRPIVCVRR
jgi:hypothetical protein